MEIVVYIAASLASGVIAGMGMGGGTILIPALTLFAALGQHAAQGVNLISFLPASIVALIVHIKAKRVDVRRCIPLIIGGVLGAVGGALLALWLEQDWLRRCFGGFLLVLSVLQFTMGEKAHKKKKEGQENQESPEERETREARDGQG